MKTLIAGYGSIGKRHLNNLRALGEQDFILLRSHQSTLSDEDIQGIPVETDIDSALAHKPDAVIISNPTALHLDVAIPAAKAGCAILMEKPVSHNLDRVTELVSALALNSNKLLVGFQFRFHPTLRKIREILSTNEIGEPVSVRAHWGEYLPNWHPWEDFRKSYSARSDLGGGVVHTLCHPLDYLRWMFGEAESLWAFTSSLGLSLDVEDTAEIGLRYQTGVLGSVYLDFVQQPSQHTLVIIGTKGSIHWNNATGIAQVFRPGQSESMVITPPLRFERNHLFLEEARHFIRVEKGLEKPLCGLEDGIVALKLALAVHESANTGRLISFGN
jgi:predicted dehydrogenase